jgi:hypothetical protein
MIKDEETGETKRVQVPRLMRRWWWQNETDVVLLELRYGNKPIAIADNKSTIEVGPMDKLPDRQIKYESTAFQFGNSSVPK